MVRQGPAKTQRVLSSETVLSKQLERGEGVPEQSP